ncbi:hypothetical protein V8D89_007397 [Ganoderma adspersum]
MSDDLYPCRSADLSYYLSIAPATTNHTRLPISLCSALPCPILPPPISAVHPRRSICIVNTVTVESQYIHKMVRSSSSPRNPKPPSSELCNHQII